MFNIHTSGLIRSVYSGWLTAQSGLVRVFHSKGSDHAGFGPSRCKIGQAERRGLNTELGRGLWAYIPLQTFLLLTMFFRALHYESFSGPHSTRI